MVKEVYKITNKLNGKIYIGQSLNTQRRWKEHQASWVQNSIINKAVRKYGPENFEIEILYKGENYNEKEKYFIEHFDSINKGYNLLPGGEEPPILKGDKNPATTHEEEWVDALVERIAETKDSFREIAIDFNCAVSTVERINRGELRARENLTYPIRKKKLNKEDLTFIVYSLKETELSIKEIADLVHIKNNRVQELNRGKTYSFLSPKHPIREYKNEHNLGSNQIKTIKKILKNACFDDLKTISKEVGFDCLRIYLVNIGLIGFEEMEKYPINERIQPNQQIIKFLKLLGESEEKR